MSASMLSSVFPSATPLHKAVLLLDLQCCCGLHCEVECEGVLSVSCERLQDLRVGVMVLQLCKEMKLALAC